MGDDQTRGRRRWTGVAALLVMALAPLAGFLVAGLIADWWVERTSVSSLSMALLGFVVVALPSLLPIAVAQPGWMRWLTLGSMTGVAAAAAVVIVYSDDAQAGLAVRNSQDLWIGLFR